MPYVVFDADRSRDAVNHDLADVPHLLNTFAPIRTFAPVGTLRTCGHSLGTGRHLGHPGTYRYY